MRNRIPFLIALLRFYLDEHAELAADEEEHLAPIPKEEDIVAAFAHQEQVVHRGEPSRTWTPRRSLATP